MIEESMMEKDNRIQNLEEQLKEKNKKNDNLNLQNEKHLERNKDLEKQVEILKNYAKKDSMPIRYEECLAIQLFVIVKNEVIDKKQTVEKIEKGKKKVEEDSDDAFISSLCNKVKVNKRMATSSKPQNDTKKKQTREKMTDCY